MQPQALSNPAENLRCYTTGLLVMVHWISIRNPKKNGNAGHDLPTF
jgi:hypothetical protein